MIYSHHAAKVVAVMKKVAWRRGFDKIQDAAAEESKAISEIRSYETNYLDEEDENPHDHEKRMNEREKKPSLFSAIKANRELEQKNNVGHLRVG